MKARCLSIIARRCSAGGGARWRHRGWRLLARRALRAGDGRGEAGQLHLPDAAGGTSPSISAPTLRLGFSSYSLSSFVASRQYFVLRSNRQHLAKSSSTVGVVRFARHHAVPAQLRLTSPMSGSIWVPLQLNGPRAHPAIIGQPADMRSWVPRRPSTLSDWEVTSASR
jgi:hypothetical protein